MPDPFEMYRVFFSTPGALDAEREALHDAVGKANEDGGMADGVLFIPVTLRGAAAAGGLMPAVRQNVRDADYFVQVLGTSWGPPGAEYEELFRFALDCRDDAKLPMKEVVAIFKECRPGREKTDVAEFRKSLAGSGLRIFTITETEEIERCALDLLNEWRKILKKKP